MRRALLAALLCIALTATGTAARAGQGSAQWNDPEGDATALGSMESSPRPSDDELDILSSQYRFAGDDLVAMTRIKRIGYAPGSGASAFRLHFSFRSQRYYFEAVVGASWEYMSTFMPCQGCSGFYRAGPSGPEEIACACRTSWDFKSGSWVAFTVRKSSLARALGVGVGQLDLGDLRVETLRHLYSYSPSDVSVAPKGLRLTH